MDTDAVNWVVVILLVDHEKTCAFSLFVAVRITFGDALKVFPKLTTWEAGVVAADGVMLTVPMAICRLPACHTSSPSTETLLLNVPETPRMVWKYKRPTGLFTVPIVKDPDGFGVMEVNSPMLPCTVSAYTSFPPR